MPRETQFTWSYRDLAALCEMDYSGVKQAASRHEFDPLDFKTLFPFIARKGTPAIRNAMIKYATHQTPANPLVKKPRRIAPARLKKAKD